SPIAAVKAILDAGSQGHFATGQIRSVGLAASQTIGYGDDGSGNISLRITLPGDSDLNGIVDFNDFLVLQNYFNAPGTTFAQGNFNFDGSTDFNDFLVLQNNFGQTLGGAAEPISNSERAALSAFATSVPEPAAVSLIATSVVGLRRRRIGK
ncbi:MAG: hypothetical protein JWM57_1290, partial [Phycisphaerales bacterium]|nr:hypothetical protein [Phycisphaerales bacterium]